MWPARVDLQLALPVGLHRVAEARHSNAEDWGGDRKPYMEALEAASVREDIGPFAEFLGRLVRNGLSGAPDRLADIARI